MGKSTCHGWKWALISHVGTVRIDDSIFCAQNVTNSLTSVQSSLNAVPNLAAYIQALTPAVTAYIALGPTLFTDVQSQITSINSSITSVRQP